MNYTEIKTALKSFQAQGYPVPALNSKREILEIALKELQALAIVVVVEDTIAPIEETPESVPAAIEPSPDPTVITPQRIRPEHPALSELKELARLTEITLIWGITLVRSLIRFSTPNLIRAVKISTPYLRRFAHDALRITIYAGVIFEVWLVPKIQLAGYRLALWAVLIAVMVKKRRWAIA